MSSIIIKGPVPLPSRSLRESKVEAPTHVGGENIIIQSRWSTRGKCALWPFFVVDLYRGRVRPTAPGFDSLVRFSLIPTPLRVGNSVRSTLRSHRLQGLHLSFRHNGNRQMWWRDSKSKGERFHRSKENYYKVKIKEPSHKGGPLLRTLHSSLGVHCGRPIQRDQSKKSQQDF